MSEKFKHYTVLLNETVDALDCKGGLLYIDGTLGGGGHSKEIIKKIVPDGKVFGFDIDPVALKKAKENLAEWSENITIVKSSYTEIPEMLKSLNIEKISGGVVLDLGASYYQLTSTVRGFSFKNDSPLDMRFDPQSPLSAYDVVNGYSEEELVRIFKEYGEERFPGRIARNIAEKRKIQKIQTTKELADIIVKSVPGSRSRIHPATRAFQAVRIEVNDELENIKNTLKRVITILEKNARIAVISFHSLEDRIVKQTFKYYASNCNCDRFQPICKCEPRQLEIITKKPIMASDQELRENPPSRSAKLRVAKKV